MALAENLIILRNLAKAINTRFFFSPDLKIGAIDFKFREIIQSRRDDIIINR